MAENFYLPTDYSSEVTFNPKNRKLLSRFQLLSRLDEWFEGMYFRVHTPVTWTRWNLTTAKTSLIPGTNAYGPRLLQ